MSSTLDRRIRDDLEAAIRSGAWPPGHRIPTEAALGAQYGCARMTVSKAVSALVQRGLIERRKRAGSFVARPHLQVPALEIPDIAAVVAARGESYRFELLSRAVAAAAAQAPWDIDAWEGGGSAPSGEVLAVAGVHRVAERPFALEHRLIDLEAAPEARWANFSRQAPGSWLLAHVPWTEARHRIRARHAGAEGARRLGLARNAACLEVERWTWRAGRPVTFARQLFPGDAYDVIAEFAPRR